MLCPFDLAMGLRPVHLRHFQGWVGTVRVRALRPTRKGWAEGWTAEDPHKHWLCPTVQPVQPSFYACTGAHARETCAMLRDSALDLGFRLDRLDGWTEPGKTRHLRRPTPVQP